MISASACAKVILFGEHAVVYGEPAIAVPVSALRASAHIQAYDTAFQIVARDMNHTVISFDIDHPLAQVVRLTLEILQEPTPNITIDVTSTIPIASGLGSGAAISTAIVRLLASHFEADLPEEAINEIVFEVEKIHHGTPSGIDNTVIVYEKPIYFVKGQGIKTIGNRVPLRVLVGDTGQVALTKDSVGDVRRLYEVKRQVIEPIIQEIGRITKQSRQAMQSGDLVRLGQLMTSNHAALQDLTVSSPELDKLVTVAIEAGAYGAKLSGGGRGGNMIALVDDNNASDIRDALLDAGAVRVFETVVGASV